MLFSAREFHNFLQGNAHACQSANFILREGGYSRNPPSLKQTALILRKAREAILSRDELIMDRLNIYKWYRPWVVVPKLANFQVPEGDYSIGIEVEYGFQSLEAAKKIANVIKNWRYITIDNEGGLHGMEVTFAPTLLSKINSKMQAFRYLRLLNWYDECVRDHRAGEMIGTHVNVSYMGYDRDYEDDNYERLKSINSVFDTRHDYLYDEFDNQMLTFDQQEKYFGRVPYEGLNFQETHIEFKCFNSVKDWKKLRKYINIAVALTDLYRSNEEISYDTVVAALERGYNKA